MERQSNHRQCRQSKGKKWNCKNGANRGVDISVGQKGDDMTIKIPAQFADFLRNGLSVLQGSEANSPPWHSKRDFKSLPEWKKEKIRARRAKWQEHRQKARAAKEANVLKEETPRNSSGEKVMEKRIKAAIENGEGIPEWVLNLLPPVQDEENNQAEEQNDNVQESADEQFEDDDVGNDDNKPYHWKNRNQGKYHYRQKMREARMKKFQANGCKNNNNCNRMSRGRRNGKRCSKDFKKDGKIVRITNQEKVTKKFGPFELDIIKTDKEIMTPKPRAQAKKEASSADQSILELLSGLEEDEKLQMLQLLVKLVGKNNN